MRTTCVLALLAAMIVSVALTAAQPRGGERTPEAVAAEASFFAALNGDPAGRDRAVADLYAAFRADPGDAGTNLWLGLAHLWIAAEGNRADPGLLADLVLARHFLRRAAELDPADSRIPSWLLSAEKAVALAEGDAAAAAAAEKGLEKAAAADPTFHSVALAIAYWDRPSDSDAFGAALAALRAASAAAPGDQSAVNMPRWPHNVEGFCLAAAQYELRAGETRRAAVLLNAAQEQPSYRTWLFRDLADRTLDDLPGIAARYADDDPANDPPLVIGPRSGIGCRVCHQGP